MFSPGKPPRRGSRRPRGRALPEPVRGRRRWRRSVEGNGGAPRGRGRTGSTAPPRRPTAESSPRRSSRQRPSKASRNCCGGRSGNCCGGRGRKTAETQTRTRRAARRRTAPATEKTAQRQVEAKRRSQPQEPQSLSTSPALPRTSPSLKPLKPFMMPEAPTLLVAKLLAALPMTQSEVLLPQPTSMLPKELAKATACGAFPLGTSSMSHQRLLYQRCSSRRFQRNCRRHHP